MVVGQRSSTFRDGRQVVGKGACVVLERVFLLQEAGRLLIRLASLLVVVGERTGRSVDGQSQVEDRLQTTQAQIGGKGHIASRLGKVYISVSISPLHVDIVLITLYNRNTLDMESCIHPYDLLVFAVESVPVVVCSLAK